MSIYLKFPNRADIYDKTTVTTESGQKKPTYTVETSAVKCQWAPRYPRYGLTRVNPTYEQTEVINMFFPGDIELTYDKRIYNVTDRVGNEVDPGPFEIVAIIKQPGWTGKIHHYLITVQRVIET